MDNGVREVTFFGRDARVLRDGAVHALDLRRMDRAIHPRRRSAIRLERYRFSGSKVELRADGREIGIALESIGPLEKGVNVIELDFRAGVQVPIQSGG